MDRQALQRLGFQGDDLDRIEALQVKPGDKIFRTQFGSLYKLSTDGTSTRFKGLFHHGGDIGLREPHEKVIFVDQEVVSKLTCYFQTDIKEELGALYLIKDPSTQKWQVISDKSTLPGAAPDAPMQVEYVIPDFETAPKIGLSPLEITTRDLPQMEVAKAHHPGHPITEMFEIPS
jgi:hypothetical protein